MSILCKCRILCLLTAFVSVDWAHAEAIRELQVHLAQANNDSPYSFVRAKFEPGEVLDPWAVRFFDEKGAEVPYFVWDSTTWEVAREGRADWGRRYALVNHAPGCAPGVLAARGRKLQWAKENVPELGAKLEAQDEAAKLAGQSVCAALYVLRHQTPPYAKERLTLRVYPTHQVAPKVQKWQGQKVDEPVSIKQGELCFRDLPNRVSVTSKGKELFRYAGFDAGGTTGTDSHADPSRPLTCKYRSEPSGPLNGDDCAASWPRPLRLLAQVEPPGLALAGADRAADGLPGLPVRRPFQLRARQVDREGRVGVCLPLARRASAPDGHASLQGHSIACAKLPYGQPPSDGELLRADRRVAQPEAKSLVAIAAFKGDAPAPGEVRIGGTKPASLPGKYVRKGNETLILDFSEPNTPVKTVRAPVTSAFPPGIGNAKPIIFGEQIR
ncbi:MAG: hypothetical protein ISR77_12515 [Pirellulaceae bacterium]|nr:hypothetical protein [Pirellulaceae bacterium]